MSVKNISSGLMGLFLFFSHLSAEVISVHVSSENPPTPVIAGAVLVGSGDAWNNLSSDVENNSTEINGSAPIALRNSAGNPSGVSLTHDNFYRHFGGNQLDRGFLKPFNNGWFSREANEGVPSFTLSGLNAGDRLDLVVFCGSNEGEDRGTVRIVAEAGAMVTRYLDCSGSTISSYISGGSVNPPPANSNYVFFSNLAPNANGEVVVTLDALGGNFSDFNGFQIDLTRDPNNLPVLPTFEQGFTFRVFDIQEPMDQLFALVVGQTPNVDEKHDVIDYESVASFEGFSDQFIAELSGRIEAPSSGLYDFRLTSDDGSVLSLNGNVVIDHDGVHGPTSMTGSALLTAGANPFEIRYFENAGEQKLLLEWRPPGGSAFSLVPATAFSTEANVTRVVAPGKKTINRVGDGNRPGKGQPLTSAHPSWQVLQARPASFRPKVGALAVHPDGRLFVSTFEPNQRDTPNPNAGGDGKVYALTNVNQSNPNAIGVREVAATLSEPLGMTFVGGDLIVSQRDALTRLVDQNGDGYYETQETVTDGWETDNYHQFHFGLVEKDGYAYSALSTSISRPEDFPGQTVVGLNGPNPRNRGSLMKTDLATGTHTFVAGGLRTPNGLAEGPEGTILNSDNQGAWVPASKLQILEEGRFYGFYNNTTLTNAKYPNGGFPSDFSDQPTTPPTVWLPHNEVANSPSEMVEIASGTYAGQYFMGEVTLGGIRRASFEKVDGVWQGCAYRFSQGFEGGVNRLRWADDGSLYVGCIGAAGNWAWQGTQFGLQRLVPRGGAETTYDIKEVKATPTGFQIEYTKPVLSAVATAASSYKVSQYTYTPTAQYGGAKQNQASLTVTGVTLSDDKRTARIEVGGLKTGYVHHIVADIPSDAGELLWTAEAWYTLNQVPNSFPAMSDGTGGGDGGNDGGSGDTGGGPALSATLQETFDYPGGALAGKDGGDVLGEWGSAWTTTTTGHLIEAGSLPHLSLTGDAVGNKVRLDGGGRAYRSLDKSYGASGTTVYMSFLMQVEGNGPANNPPYYAFELWADAVPSGASADRVFELGVIRRNGGNTRNFEATAGGATKSIFGDIAAFDTDSHLFVIRFDFSAGNDVVSIFVDPTDERDLTGAGDFTVSDRDLRFQSIGLANFVGVAGGYAVDEMIVSESPPTFGVAGLSPRFVGASPADGATLAVGSDVSIEVAVDAPATAVVLSRNGVELRSIASQPFAWNTAEQGDELLQNLAPGTYIFTANATLESGAVEESNLSITVASPPVSNAYTTFLGGYLDVAQLADIVVSDPLADPDRDGRRNLIEYALVGHPLQADSLVDIGMVEVQGIFYPSITFMRQDSASELDMVIQSSSDLITWDDETTGMLEVASVAQGDGTSQVTYRWDTALSLSSMKMFRVKVSVRE